MTPTRRPRKTLADLLPSWDTETLIQFKWDLVNLIEALEYEEEEEDAAKQRAELVLVRAELAKRGYK
jgi:hypothetical protein